MRCILTHTSLPTNDVRTSFDYDVGKERKNLQERLHLLREPGRDNVEDVQEEVNLARQLQALEVSATASQDGKTVLKYVPPKEIPMNL